MDFEQEIKRLNKELCCLKKSIVSGANSGGVGTPDGTTPTLQLVNAAGNTSDRGMYLDTSGTGGGTIDIKPKISPGQSYPFIRFIKDSNTSDWMFDGNNTKISSTKNEAESFAIVLPVPHTDEGNTEATFRKLSGIVALLEDFAPIPITKSELSSIILSSDLIVGAWYMITNSTAIDDVKYVFAQALKRNKLSTRGYAIRYVPDHQNNSSYCLGQWVNTMDISGQAGNIVIYNNKHWYIDDDRAPEGTSPDIDTDTYNLLVDYNPSNYYQEEVFIVDYNIDLDQFYYIKDERGNELGVSNDIGNYSDGYSQEWINIFQWGNNNVYGNYSIGGQIRCVNQLGIVCFNRCTSGGYMDLSRPEGDTTWSGGEISENIVSGIRHSFYADGISVEQITKQVYDRPEFSARVVRKLDEEGGIQILKVNRSIGLDTVVPTNNSTGFSLVFSSPVFEGMKFNVSSTHNVDISVCGFLGSRPIICSAEIINDDKIKVYLCDYLGNSLGTGQVFDWVDIHLTGFPIDPNS